VIESQNQRDHLVIDCPGVKVSRLTSEDHTSRRDQRRKQIHTAVRNMATALDYLSMEGGYLNSIREEDRSTSLFNTYNFGESNDQL
jgi:hypothetical protein